MVRSDLSMVRTTFFTDDSSVCPSASSSSADPETDALLGVGEMGRGRPHRAQWYRGGAGAGAGGAGGAGGEGLVEGAGAGAGVGGEGLVEGAGGAGAGAGAGAGGVGCVEGIGDGHLQGSNGSHVVMYMS